MCQDCGCIETGQIKIEGKAQGSTREISLKADILAENDSLATHNREHLKKKDVLALNWIGAPGAGKTAVIEALINQQNLKRPLKVIEGDQETAQDAERIRRLGIPALQINTGSACHLDAKMVHQAFHQMDLTLGDLLVIENVGNMVCPTSFDLGEEAKVAIFSTPEGDDKPLKYPDLVLCADLLVLNKIDLLPYLDFDLAAFSSYVRQLRPHLPIISVSAKTGEGIDEFCTWINQAGAKA